jgi:membrane protease YdiL (CAAX protease family)
VSANAIESGSRRVMGVRTIALNLVVTVGLTLAITATFGKQHLFDLLRGDPWPIQVMWGIGIGLLFTLPLWALFTRVRWFDAYYRQMIELASRLDLRGFNPLWFSLCAGVGEELLFRGAVQPLAGLWLTSVIFTALHYQTGGFRKMNRWKAIYALLIFLVSLGLGILSVRIGLIAAMVTHTFADIVGLMSLRTPRRASPP